MNKILNECFWIEYWIEWFFSIIQRSIEFSISIAQGYSALKPSWQVFRVPPPPAMSIWTEIFLLEASLITRIQCTRPSLIIVRICCTIVQLHMPDPHINTITRIWLRLTSSHERGIFLSVRAISGLKGEYLILGSTQDLFKNALCFKGTVASRHLNCGIVCLPHFKKEGIIFQAIHPM